MLYTNVVAVGNKVTLSKEAGFPVEEKGKRYVSQVLDLVGPDKAVMSMPMENNRVIPLSVGDTYCGFFYTKSGMYQCKCQICDRYKEDNFYMMTVKFVSPFEKYQRRQFFRLEMLKEIQYRFVSPEEEIIEQKILENNFQDESTKNKYINTLNNLRCQWNTAIATDLSGGGMRFNAQTDVEDAEKVEVKISFQAGKNDYEYDIRGKIIRSNKMSNKSGFREYRVSFYNISREKREILIKYIFEEERKRRKND